MKFSEEMIDYANYLGAVKAMEEEALKSEESAGSDETEGSMEFVPDEA